MAIAHHEPMAQVSLKIFTISGPNFLPLRWSLFYFSGAGKFCLAHGLRQLTCNGGKSDVRTLYGRSHVIYGPPPNMSNDVQRRLIWEVKCHK